MRVYDSVCVEARACFALLWQRATMAFKQEHRVQDMVEQGLTEVPQAFIQPPHLRPGAQKNSNNQTTVPVIDMAQDDKAQVRAQITRACQDWGFFLLINHGVPAALMDAAMHMARHFFALSSQEKQVFHMRTGSPLGYGRFFQQATASQAREWLDRLVINASSARDSAQSDLVFDNPPGLQ